MGSGKWINQNNVWTSEMMSDKDCKDLEKTLDNLRGPNDLEEKIRILEFRNAKLHQHNEKIEREVLELRGKIKELEQAQIDQFRNKGDMQYDKRKYTCTDI